MDPGVCSGLLYRMVPAQLTNIPINLTGNKWETIIELASEEK